MWTALTIQERPRLLQRSFVLRVGESVDRDRSGSRPVQTHDHAHGGGFPGAVWPQESGNLPGFDGETDTTYGSFAP